MKDDRTKPEAEPPGPARRSYPVALYFIALALVTLFPAITFSGLLVQRNNAAQEEIVRALTVATARSIMQSVEREIDGMITTLRVLASTPSLDAHDYRTFHNRTQRALMGTGTYLQLLDDDLHQILNTRVPYGAELGSTSDLASARKALEGSVPVVSNLFFNDTTQQWAFNVLVPFLEDGEAQQVLLLSQNAGNLSAPLLNNKMPQGWYVSIVDRENVVVATSRDNADVGQPFFLPPELLQRGGSEWISAAVNDGKFQIIVQKSFLTGWTLVAWAPLSVVSQPLNETVKILALGGSAIFALVAIVVWLLSRQVSFSVQRLARQAADLGRGDIVEARHYPVIELRQVSEALADAARRRLAFENEIRLLMREVAHRSKNQLSVISSMASQTAQGSDTVENFLDAFQKRVVGLARSTDLLLAHGAGGTGLRDLIAVQLEPFRPEKPDRVRIRGRDIQIGAQSAQTLGMAIHELSTNAAKYGAFATEEGWLDIWLSVEGDNFVMVWREHAEGLPERPDRQGFGTTVIETIVRTSFGAEVTRTMHEDGIEWRFEIPRARLDPVEKLAGLEETEEKSTD